MTEWIGSPIAGKGKRLEELNDEMFASKALGDGLAVKPSELFAKREIVSPVDGEVTMVYETGHALGILTTGCHELLIHIGIDTVNLKGLPFETKVKVGDQVSRGDLLCLADWKLMRKHGCDTDVIMIALNSEIEILSTSGKVNVLDPLFEMK